MESRNEIKMNGKSMMIQAASEYVLLEVVSAEEIRGGIVIPEESAKNFQIYRIIDTGPQAEDILGMEVKKGDFARVVHVPPQMNNMLALRTDDDDIMAIHASNICAIMHGD